MIKPFWWLEILFQRSLFSKKQAVCLQQPDVKLKTRKLRTDAEYESLFLQLLAGVNDEYWTHGRVRGFLDANNIADADFVEWLRRFGEKLLAADGDNHELGMRLVRLSQVGCGRLEDVGCGVLGEVAGEIGMELLRRAGKKEVVER
ncbi:MAG: hypothetical protein WBA07_14085 [Rivularia sp. (in: cyanobacteria)]